MLDDWWKYIKNLSGAQKIHSIMSANKGKVRAAGTGIRLFQLEHKFTLHPNVRAAEVSAGI